MSTPTLKSPYPYFGGKSRIAELVWSRLGNVKNYVEPFFGSGAVLLARPHEPHTETINDLDCMVANFWRALQFNADAVAEYADWPVNEADQHARHLWLSTRAEFRERMKTDPDYYDAKVAGWWVWGQCIWIGREWCAKQFDGDAGTGLNRQRPHLGNAGTGLNRQRPHLGNADTDTTIFTGDSLIHGTPSHLHNLAYLRQLACRLRRVRVCCGDWSRVTGPSVTIKHGITGVFLDPPYAAGTGRDTKLYAREDLTVSHDVREWAIKQGHNQEMRIALCGYEGEHTMPQDWECVHWKAKGGFGLQGNNAARENRHRERVWFSPYCLNKETLRKEEGEEGDGAQGMQHRCDDPTCLYCMMTMARG